MAEESGIVIISAEIRAGLEMKQANRAHDEQVLRLLTARIPVLPFDEFLSTLNFMKIIKQLLFMVPALALPGVHAATTGVDCENAAAAKTYSVNFQSLVSAEAEKNKTREKARQQAFESHRDRLIAAGIWRQTDASAFITNAFSTLPELKVLEEKRVKAAKEIEVLRFSILGLPVVSAGNQQAEFRAGCILGQKLMAQLSVSDDAAENAWQLVNQRVEAFAREKGIN